MQYICSKTEDEGNIYAARQEMRACNNNNMRNPSLWGYACYYCCMPSSPVLLHIGGVTHVIIVACPHLLSCCIYIALIFCLAAYILHALVSLLFGTVIPTSFNILMEIFLLPCFTGFSLHTHLQIQCSLRLFEPHPILLLVVMWYARV